MNNINIIKILAQENIKKCAKSYGIEGTEDAIKRVYTINLKLKNFMLQTLYELYYIKE